MRCSLLQPRDRNHYLPYLACSHHRVEIQAFLGSPTDLPHLQCVIY